MYRRALFYGGLAIALPALLLANSGRDPVSVAVAHYPLVQRVDCNGGFGTAFRIDQHTMISAAHVTVNGGCRIRGASYAVTEQNGQLDYAVIKLEGAGQMPINCDGFVPGQWYFAVGHANAAPWQTVVPVFATVLMHDSGQRILRNMFIPGMSGGPVLNGKGEVVGIVNARNTDYDISFSRELRDTSLCDGRRG